VPVAHALLGCGVPLDGEALPMVPALPVARSPSGLPCQQGKPGATPWLLIVGKMQDRQSPRLYQNLPVNFCIAPF